jgi:hypothetical protein
LFHLILRYIIKKQESEAIANTVTSTLLLIHKEDLPMSQLARESKVKDLLDKQKFNQNEISEMTDPQIEYYHWLYFEDSVYDYM